MEVYDDDHDEQDDNEEHDPTVDELHKRDTLIKILRDIENSSKYDIIIMMVKAKHNSKYNKNLIPSYLAIRDKFDKYVKEQHGSVENLEKIISHLDNILLEFIRKRGEKDGKNSMDKYNDNDIESEKFIADIMKEKQKVSKILVKMRIVLNKFNEVDSLGNNTTLVVLNSGTVIS